MLFGKIGIFGAKLLYSDKMVVFGQNVCIWAKLMYLGKSGVL